jgi:hypothetical protein
MKTLFHDQNLKEELSIWAYALITVLVALLVGLLILNPLWVRLSPPFPHPEVSPAIAAPVDGPFYLRLAKHGYDWLTRDPLSLWYHPLVPILLRMMPSALPLELRFLLLSGGLGLISLILTYKLLIFLTDLPVMPPQVLLLSLLAPGGLGIGTGNAEFPILFFALLLLLSVLVWQKWWLTFIAAVLAMLAKPNALYMVPILFVYLVVAIADLDRRLFGHALLGIIMLIATWLCWMLFVDWQTGVSWSYWNARTSFGHYVAGNPWLFFDYSARLLLYGGDFRDQIRYSTALIVPVVSLFVIGLVPWRRECHGYAVAAGVLAMLVIALAQGNPNKMIVYPTTIPGHLVVHLALTVALVFGGFHPTRNRIATALGYTAYCVAMLMVYVFGTGLGWYY